MTNKSWAPPQTRNPARIPQKVTQLPNLPPFSRTPTPTHPTDNRNTSSPLRHQQQAQPTSSSNSNRYNISSLSLWCARTLAERSNPLEKVKNMAAHQQISPSDSNNPRRSRCTLNRWKPRMLSLKILRTRWTQACHRTTTSSAAKDIRITTKICWQIT